MGQVGFGMALCSQDLGPSGLKIKKIDPFLPVCNSIDFEI
jgi:hypothetical protein